MFNTLKKGNLRSQPASTWFIADTLNATDLRQRSQAICQKRGPFLTWRFSLFIWKIIYRFSLWFLYGVISTLSLSILFTLRPTFLSSSSGVASCMIILPQLGILLQPVSIILLVRELLLSPSLFTISVSISLAKVSVDCMRSFRLLFIVYSKSLLVFTTLRVRDIPAKESRLQSIAWSARGSFA